ncbi:MAG TPA: type III-A CRISPR-associated RAMP protein Csm5, partial [Tissierellaceae bacterium]|nr:type III-A CRISPR-associated RAMP protein Csm5 [Tissierellaceae bacterium]
MRRDAGITTYKMKIKVLTPTFIGGGEDSSINKSQYIYDSKNKKLSIIDERKLASFLGKKNLLGFYSGYVKEVSNLGKGKNSNANDMNIGEWYKKMLSMIKSDGDLSQCIKYTLDVSNIQRNQLNDVACFIKDVEGMPYIPGSSLKGSFANAILVHHIKNNSNKYSSYWKDIKKETSRPGVNKWKLGKICDDLTKEIFDYNRTVNNQRHSIKGMSGISISDTEQFKRDSMKLYQRKDLLLTDKKENKLPIFRECLISPSQSSFSLTIDHLKIKEDLGIKSVEDILDAMDTQFELLAGKDGLFQIFDNLNTMIPYDGNDRGMLFMGGGTGYLAKTIIAALAPSKEDLLKSVRNILHKDKPVTFIHKNDKKISPRTLKVSD